jgi:hypothetical protein
MEPFGITGRETEAVAAAIWHPPISSDVSRLREKEVLPSFSQCCGPDPGSGAFLAPGPGIGFFRIPDPKHIFFKT